MDMRIERGTPMPSKHAGATKYPWEKLKVGERFAVEGASNGRSLCVCANRTRAPKVFESRIVNGETWVWRTK